MTAGEDLVHPGGVGARRSAAKGGGEGRGGGRGHRPQTGQEGDQKVVPDEQQIVPGDDIVVSEDIAINSWRLTISYGGLSSGHLRLTINPQGLI